MLPKHPVTLETNQSEVNQEILLLQAPMYSFGESWKGKQELEWLQSQKLPSNNFWIQNEAIKHLNRINEQKFHRIALIEF